MIGRTTSLTVVRFGPVPGSRLGELIERVYETLGWVALAAGVLLRTIQYAAGASLWVDEAAIARTVVEGSFVSFMHPLPFGQVAPILFLALERASALLFGPGERALRLLPFVCSLLALPVFVRIARRVLPPSAAWLSVLMFSLATPFIFFGSDLKPYVVDVLVTLLAIDVAARYASDDLDLRSVRWVGALGLLAWVSHIAVLTLAGIGSGLAVLHWRRGSQARRALILIGVLWVMTAGPTVWLAQRNVTPSASAYLHRRWAEGFPPGHPRHAAKWLWQTASGLLDNPSTDGLDGALHYRFWWVVGALGLVGLRGSWATSRSASLFMYAPAVVVLCAAGAHLYPFAGRFVIFLIPSVLVAVGAGVAECGRLARSRLLETLVGGAVAAVSIAAAARTPPPQYREDMTPVLEHIRSRPSNERIYVYYGAAQAFLFYAPRFGFDSGRYTIGRCARGRLQLAFDELEQFKGAPRTWVVFSHVAGQPEERARILDYLDAAGRQVDAVWGRGQDAATAYLYELSDAARWERARAVVQAPPPAPELLWQCQGPMSALDVN